MTRILIFAKEPVAGRVKTRLIPALGTEGAARLARDLLQRTIEEAVAATIGPVELCGEPDPADWRDHPGIVASAQGEGDLGERLSRAARRVIDNGERPLLIGADSPDLEREHLRRAAKALETHDAVIHPAHDGGYVLLGLRRFDPTLFTDMPWSTPAVAAETRRRIEALGWSLHVGETLADVDEPEDLRLVGPGC